MGVKKGLKRATLGANGEHISDCSIRRLARRGGAPPAAAALSRKGSFASAAFASFNLTLTAARLGFTA